jgi:glucosylceramidase
MTPTFISLGTSSPLAQRTQLMSGLFSPSGLHLSFLRQGMGANDFSLSSYTYDDLLPGEPDPQMKQFSIAHDEASILPWRRRRAQRTS